MTILLEAIARQQQASIKALNNLELAVKALVAVDEIKPEKKRAIGGHIEQAQISLRSLVNTTGDLLANTTLEDLR